MFPSETMKRTATLILALRRFWATAAAGLAFVGAIVGGLAVADPPALSAPGPWCAGSGPFAPHRQPADWLTA
jgi:hypothetical protein